MSRIDKINELISIMNKAPSKACERLIKLFDENSFVELGALNKSAGVVTGYGTVNGKLVYAYSQEGAVGKEHVRKIDSIYSLAIKLGCPVIGVLDSEGVVLDDGLEIFDNYGQLFRLQSQARGIIPQIAVITGSCLGMAGYVAELSDIVIMAENGAKMFMSSPATFKGLEGKATSFAELGGAKTLSEEGIVHLVCEDENCCLKKAREVIDLLPENNHEINIVDTNDDLNRTDSALDAIVPEDDETPIDIRYIIKSIADNNYFLEIKENYAKHIVTGFIRLDGITTGVIANDGLLNTSSVKKSGEFVNFCNAFNIPIITFTDILGYEHSLEDERKGIIKYGAKLTYAYANATVPKINVIIRNGIGNAYVLMNSKHIGADIVYAWPSASVALLTKNAAVRVLGFDEEEYDKYASPYEAAGHGYVDSVIIPSCTRKRIIAALEALISKKEAKPERKHISVEF